MSETPKNDKAREFRAGEIVRLNSGGPVMTVQAQDKGMVRVAWFAQSELLSGSIAAACLTLADAPDEE